MIEVEGDTSLEDFEGMEVTPSAKQQQISNSAQLEDAEVRVGHIISVRKPLEERKLTEQLHSYSSRQEVKQRRQDSHKTLCEEPKLYLGDTSLSDIERFEETAGSSSVRESGISLADLEDDDSLDSILREALENYESLLLPGDN